MFGPVLGREFDVDGDRGREGVGLLLMSYDWATSRWGYPS